MTESQKNRMAELETLYLKSVKGYDGHSMYPGLPRNLAAELVRLRAFSSAV